MTTLLLTFLLANALIFAIIQANRIASLVISNRSAAQKIEALTTELQRYVTQGHLVIGPNATLIVYPDEDIGVALEDVCGSNGDKPTDYTAVPIYFKANAPGAKS